MFRRRNIILNSLLVIVLGVIGFFGWRILYPPVVAAAVRTATISVQDVTTSVSATGSVQTAMDVGLNFASSGIVKTLNVKVGDQVRKGQLLATVDDRAAQLALLQAQVSETNAEVSVKNAEVSVKNAELAIIQGQQSAQQTQATDDQAIANTQAALAKLVAGPTATNLVVQTQQIAAAQLSIDNATAAYQNALTSQKQIEETIALNLVAYNRTLERAQYDYDQRCPYVIATGGDCVTNTYSRTQYLALQDATQAKVVGLTKDQQSDANAISNVDNVRRSLLTAQAALETLKAQQAVTNQPAAQVDIDVANANIVTAQRAKAAAAVLATQQAEQAAGSLVNAAGSLVNAKGSLKIAKASVANAQVNVANTRLYSPVSATVAAVANDVGVNAGSTTAGSSGAAGFIVLTELSGLQVKASFAEADIVSLQVGQIATFTFDAIANSTAQGTVLSIAPLNNVSTGSVTSYNVIFSLDIAPAEVKPGMTAQVSVVTAQAPGVLAVTSTALTQRGNTYYVTMKPTIVGGVGVRKAVTIGLKGDSATEITSGLKVGDQVVLRSTTTTSTSNGFPGGGVPGGAGIGSAVRAGG